MQPIDNTPVVNKNIQDREGMSGKLGRHLGCEGLGPSQVIILPEIQVQKRSKESDQRDSPNSKPFLVM